MRTIKFCRINDEYGFLSNFAPYSFETEEFSAKNNSYYKVFWKTSEHYYQAMKFVGTDWDHSNRIRLADNPMEAARFGRDKSHILRPDWEHIKEIIMERALIEKFSQNPDIKQKLIDTRDAILVEHRKADSYWGDAGNGTGKNRLGILLMNVRNLLKK